jgi:hypothetical protein
VLSEVDVKFSKFVDKECDVINGEVKKWFKKLAVCPSTSFRACVAPTYLVEGRESPRRKDSKCKREDQASRCVYAAWGYYILTLALGLLYEKKAKRNAIDASEEHNRYINLLNTLGPEISQAK